MLTNHLLPVARRSGDGPDTFSFSLTEPGQDPFDNHHVASDARDTITEIGLGLAAVGAAHSVLPATEDAVRGRAADEETIALAGLRASEECAPTTDQRGPADYKRALVGELIQRALRIAGTPFRVGDRGPRPPADQQGGGLRHRAGRRRARRCLFHWIDYPDAERSAEIIRRRVPGSSRLLAHQVATTIEKLRGLELQKPPGIAEAIDWVGSLELLGVRAVDADAIDRTLGSALPFVDALVSGHSAEACVDVVGVCQ